jgi:hypothetical protein
MKVLKLIRQFKCGLILVIVLYVPGYQISEAADFLPDSSASILSPLRIIDTIPQPDSGIINSTRVHEDTAFAVLVETDFGIDLNDPDRVRFLIYDGEYEPYERNLRSAAVRVVEVENGSSQAALLWVVYDRSLDLDLPPVYAWDTVVQIYVDVEDIYQNKLSGARFEFNIESDGEQASAFDHLPESVSFNIENSTEIHDSGIEIVSGALAGARILYDGDEPLWPAFGPTHEIESVSTDSGEAVGRPLNLMPHTVFNHPVKLFLPFPEDSDITEMAVYYHNGLEWLPACDADGRVLAGGKGWMVPGSRVNHIEHMPPEIEIEVYHFSSAQAVVSGSSTTTDNKHHNTGGSGAVVYVSCFIDSAASGGISLLSLLGLLGLLSLLGLLGKEIGTRRKAHGARGKKRVL